LDNDITGVFGGTGFDPFFWGFWEMLCLKLGAISCGVIILQKGHRYINFGYMAKRTRISTQISSYHHSFKCSASVEFSLLLMIIEDLGYFSIRDSISLSKRLS
jgi:hypothetical protein